MKTKQIFAILALFISICISAGAEDLRKIVSLSGNWKFSIGDDNKWANPSYDDSGWDQITVPGNWEDQGYNDYNGYAWYRKTFRISDVPAKTTIYLVLGRIDDADVVYLNGKEIGRSGNFPPDFLTAYDNKRKYVIPEGSLKINGDNVISVKVYDSYLTGGITDGPTGIYYDTDTELLDQDFVGKWKFHTGDNKEWKSPEFNDDSWNSVYVPSAWESQGFGDYDGYAWYRLKFSISQNISNEELYITLGKIDDIDDVYLNGKHIGNVYDLRKGYYYRSTGWEYNVRRSYKIPAGLLNKSGLNTLAVRVYDGQGLGGIYEGPVGIMSAENYRRYKNKHHTQDISFFEYMIDKFFYNDNSREE